MAEKNNTSLSCTITVKVKPRAKQTICKLSDAGTLTCSVKSPPEDGRANEELIGFLSKALGIHRRDITIVSGAASRLKILKIAHAFSFDQILSALNIIKEDPSSTGTEQQSSWLSPKNS